MACRAGQFRAAQDVGAVEELVHGAHGQQIAKRRVRDAGREGLGEAVGAQNLEGAGVVGASDGVDAVGQAQLVVQARDRLVGVRQMLLAVAPVGCGEGGGEVGGETRAHGGERTRCRATCCRADSGGPSGRQQMHQVAHEAGGDHGGPERVADLAAAADEGLLLGYALPLAGQDMEPQIVRVPAEGRS